MRGSGRHIGGWSEAGERLKIVDKGRLIVIAAGECHIGPVDIACFVERAQDALETAHSAEHLGSETDLAAEEFNEATRTETDALSYRDDSAVVSTTFELSQRIGNRWMEFERTRELL